MSVNVDLAALLVAAGFDFLSKSPKLGKLEGTVDFLSKFPRLGKADDCAGYC